MKSLVSFQVLPFFLPTPPKKGLKRQRLSPLQVLEKLYVKIEVSSKSQLWCLKTRQPWKISTVNLCGGCKLSTQSTHHQGAVSHLVCCVVILYLNRKLFMNCHSSIFSPHLRIRLRTNMGKNGLIIFYPVNALFAVICCHMLMPVLNVYRT